MFARPKSPRALILPTPGLLRMCRQQLRLDGGGTPDLATGRRPSSGERGGQDASGERQVDRLGPVQRRGSAGFGAAEPPLRRTAGRHPCGRVW